MKFLVDKPLEGLAKWLRFSGFDTRSVALPTAGPKGLPDPAPDTFLLTRQISLDKLKRPDIIVLAAEGPEEQLEEVFRRLERGNPIIDGLQVRLAALYGTHARLDVRSEGVVTIATVEISVEHPDGHHR